MSDTYNNNNKKIIKYTNNKNISTNNKIYNEYKKVGKRCHNCIYWDTNHISMFYYINNKRDEYRERFYYSLCKYIMDIGETDETCFYSAYLLKNTIYSGMNFCCMHWEGVKNYTTF